MASEILEKMSNNEYLISELYATYANNFVYLRDFWLKLSQEEIKHKNMIQYFDQKVSEGDVVFEEHRFKPEPIDLVKEYLEKKITEAKSKEITELEALIAAVDLENSLLEKNIFTIFEADSTELKNLLETLHQETAEHLEEAKEMLETEHARLKQATP